MNLLDGLQISRISLKVADLDQMTNFYHKVIGLNILEKTNNISLLGVENRVIIELVEVKNSSWGHQYNGLYHIAILLPSEVDLANMLLHLAQYNIRLGASDHGFSHALYLNDPEGNGIEIYADQPKVIWPYLNNSLDIVTKRLDLRKLASLATTNNLQSLPPQTVIGHIHLQMKDLNGFRQFYLEKLQMDLQIETPNALFASVDGYHHHIAANNWNSPIGPLPDKYLGLNYFAIKAKNFNTLKDILKNEPTFIESQNTFIVTCPNGIKIIFEQ